MRPRFLLGPAGSGKTYRCLAEIRSELRRSPEGAPLLLLAPKQATYQLERQLLESTDLQGWSRLQILSFERLASQVLDDEDLPAREILREEGRIMVLRALLRRHQSRLRVFHATARLHGFAQDLSELLREMQRHRCAPDRLIHFADRPEVDASLSGKLHDLALMLRVYQDWLTEHGMLDADLLPDLATEALRRRVADYRIEAVWMDGFAEMTPQEMELLAAVSACAGRLTVALCLDTAADEAPWFSPWAIVSQTFRHLLQRLTSEFGAAVDIEVLPRQSDQGRFQGNPILSHLEAGWAASQCPGPTSTGVDPRAIRLVACDNVENEAEVAARTILREVRSGARFRDLAVLTRSLDGFHEAIERVFTRYEIPHFVDRRAPLAHHPLAELTRSCLRLAAFRWQHEDGFGALKTGLIPIPIDIVDRLENAALEFGWAPLDWRRHAAPEFGPELKVLFDGLDPFVESVAGSPDAATLTRAIRRLWSVWQVHETLESWDERPAEGAPGDPTHLAVEEQLSLWLNDLERGFAGESMALAEWLPIVEAGLSALTAGIIPPTLDQVLVGAIDRSRQPELRTAIILGLNEGLFPSPIPSARILTEPERDRLLGWGLRLAPDRHRRLGHERYYAYIAFTRAHRNLLITWSRRDDSGKALNVSPYLRTLQQILGGWPTESDTDEIAGPGTTPAPPIHRMEHRCELIPWMIRHPGATGLDAVLQTGSFRSAMDRFQAGSTSDVLPPEWVTRLLGREPEISVSALESYAACPFQFFAQHALRGRERRKLEVDARHIGTLAHEWLARFHLELQNAGLRWRDASPAEARARFESAVAHCRLQDRSAARSLAPDERWRLDGLVTRLREAVVVLTTWAKFSELDPVLVEVSFGKGGTLPSWRLDLGAGRHLRVRGKIDRMDVHRQPDGGLTYTVLDYKIQGRRFDETMAVSGIDIQITAYLLALGAIDWTHALPDMGASGVPPSPKPNPAGMFYIGLRGRPAPTGRGPAPPAKALHPNEIHRHRGRFRESALLKLDGGAGQVPSGQYAFRVKKDGSLYRGSDGLPDADFEALLAAAHASLVEMGQGILSGAFPVSPYRHGVRKACDRCEWAAVCRFDPWVQPYRALKAPAGNRHEDAKHG
ncbi:MAG: PD-(D/E)XK nuclease family protein [Verrucomicrobiales bacterium]|nr:PD-(D/E)XK nuclease family protein [Verrucomicrobiales bacterium]